LQDSKKIGLVFTKSLNLERGASARKERMTVDVGASIKIILPS
jgi:hypothetical protein